MLPAACPCAAPRGAQPHDIALGGEAGEPRAGGMTLPEEQRVSKRPRMRPRVQAGWWQRVGQVARGEGCWRHRGGDGMRLSSPTLSGKKRFLFHVSPRRRVSCSPQRVHGCWRAGEGHRAPAHPEKCEM